MNRHDRAGRNGTGAEMLVELPIRAYQMLVSPLLPPSCRFLPTCSDYACEAVRRHGAGRGLRLALRRLVRCHPWGGSGYDPVPLPAASCRPAGDH